MTLGERVRADVSARLRAIKSDRYSGDRPMFDVAIEREHWDLAAHCLLVSAVEALQDVPPESLDALLEEIEGGIPMPAPAHRRSRRDPRGRPR
jgi:hypothetical protein